jgi:hypothetical protein
MTSGQSEGFGEDLGSEARDMSEHATNLGQQSPSEELSEILNRLDKWCERHESSQMPFLVAGREVTRACVCLESAIAALQLREEPNV